MASVAPEIPVLARDQAFETLYRRYVKDVYHYALALLHNPADAEDVTQTTFMNAYRAYKRGDVIQKPQNWLIKITHNVARSRYARASRRVKEVPLEDHLDQLALPEEDRPNVEGVLRALGRLPFNQRAAIVMRELEGRTYAEIADTIGVSVPAVETLIFRARRSLRLRASALRALAAVPLPGSLAGMFEGGGLVAGGGALAGSGFLVKAAVALMAGAVATGIGSDRTGPPTAAPQTTERVAIAPPWTAWNGLIARSREPGGLELAGKRGVRQRSAIVREARLGSIFGVHEQIETTTVGAHQEVSSAGTSNAPGPTATVAQATAPVTDLVETVEQTAAASTSTLPVELPSVPPLPVEVPPPPPAPALP
jgi:RNA polymerase sigma factor (sigma-70 family)